MESQMLEYLKSPDAQEIIRKIVNEELSKNKITPKKAPKLSPLNLDFEEIFSSCEKGKPLCFYMPKTGDGKGKGCGRPAVFVDNDDGEQVKIEGEISKEFFHSFRCPNCQKKGRTGISLSKKKCLEKIKGINVKKTGEVDTKALNFLAGSADGMVSPTRALSNSKPKPSGDEYIYDDHIHYLLAHDDNKYIFEYAKNKNNTPNQKKTPTLRGYVKEEDFDKDTYNDMIKTSVKDEILEKLKEDRKYFFDGQIIKEKKEVIIPTLEAPKKEEVDDKEMISEDAIDEILKGLGVEETKLD